MTVLLTTHYLEEADVLCDTVALLHRGRLAAAGPPARLKAALGPDATLDDVFRRHAGVDLAAQNGLGKHGSGLHGKESIRDVRRSRATARKLG